MAQRGEFIAGRRFALLSLPFVLICEPIFAQSIAPPQARIESATRVLETNPKYKSLSPKFRQQLMEFVAGNLLFVLIHELGHATISEFEIPVLGKEEDAADSFAATRLITIGTEFSDEVVVNTAKGWFMADRRDQKEGDPVPYYDEHGLDLQRAYQFVCFLVGSDEDKFRNLASETKLPKERRESCKAEYSRASKAWGAVLKPHLRAPVHPKTKIDVIYGDAKGNLEVIAQAARAMLLLEMVARRESDQFAWPEPFTMEMQTCGFPNARWDVSTHKLTVCYELGADFAEFYRSYGDVSASNLVPK
jgi:hypothetical protein